jgi:hypothetical protein
MNLMQKYCNISNVTKDELKNFNFGLTDEEIKKIIRKIKDI